MKHGYARLEIDASAAARKERQVCTEDQVRAEIIAIDSVRRQDTIPSSCNEVMLKGFRKALGSPRTPEDGRHTRDHRRYRELGRKRPAERR